MDTSRLKTFAANAREKIMDGVRLELLKKGFDKDGHVKFEPTKIQNGTIFDGQVLEENFYDQWIELKKRIETKGIDYVYEETAYTWFNRLIALQILSKNHIINEPVLQYSDVVRRIPFIVEEARNGRWNHIDDASKNRALAIINDYTKTAEVFSILISSFCRNTPIINKCFGGIAAYTEILLPSNILSEGNFISMLNDTPYITEEDYSKTELLGWLYQFYIAKRKEKVDKKNEWSADEIPAGTQIFTPNWIVKYMAENTLGRIYLDHDPSASFKEKMKYLVEPCDGDRPIYEFEDLKDLKCGDLSCGSGHILNEFFDLLLLCYQEEGYDTTTAIENIFNHNLVGIDLDTRAKQLSLFSLLLKACFHDKENFGDAHCMPRVLDMPKTYNETLVGCNLKNACLRFVGGNNNMAADKLVGCFQLLVNANDLGSIMKFKLDKDMVTLIRNQFNDWINRGVEERPKEIEAILPGIDLILALSEKYSVLCMNPPYMGTKHMNAFLKKYVTKYYPESKADLFTVFMDVAGLLLQDNGKYGMINMQNWMFISTFDKLRERVINDQQIDCLMQLGAKLFDELSGEKVKSVSFIITNSSPSYKSTFYRLVKGNNCSSKEQLFLQKCNEYKDIDQSIFKKFPKNRICFWFPERSLNVFQLPTISSIAEPREGMTTASNSRFLRFWFEVCVNKIGFGLTRNKALASGKKWFPYAKGGETRLWYGNQDYVVNWKNDGYEIQHNYDVNTGRLRSHNYNLDYIFKECISASRMNNSQRYYPQGFLCDSTGTPTYCSEGIFSVLAVANSNVSKYILDIFNPSIVIQPGDISSLPYLQNIDIEIVKNCISISKEDWDSHETSWNFKCNPLVSLCNHFNCNQNQAEPVKISSLLIDYKTYWVNEFNTLHDNEERLNRQIIKFYGLEGELSPDVPLNEITILQQGEKTIEDNKVIWHDDVLVKQLISYAMGCWMGRYRLDKPGLHIAHPSPTEEEKEPYLIFGETFEIDKDGIIPLLPRECPFTDNALNRLENFVRLVFGEETFADNWNFITNCLGNTAEYFTKTKGFWENHTKMYQKTPIYWLFCSAGGYFKCLVYMHRMNQFTVRDLREGYLQKYIDYLRNVIKPLRAEEATLGKEEKRKLVYYQNALKDCEEYDLLLNNVAQKFITFDLDDGVKANYAKFGNVLATI